MDLTVTRAPRIAKPKSKDVKLTDVNRLWAAVVARDATHDGRFVYSVATTGVYCRPSCASRLARRENVRFHDSCSMAEAAGFRACQRCKPDQISLQNGYAAKVTQACRIIETAMVMPTLADLAAAIEMSPFHFHRIFKTTTGITPKAYATAHRRKVVRDQLSKGQSVTEAVYDSGFHSSGGFYAQSTDLLGMSPTAFRKCGAGMRMQFALAHCSLGEILVAATGRGICAISMGDDAEALRRDLHHRFSDAQISSGDKSFNKLVAQVVALVERPGGNMDLPLDVRGTAFQQQVWAALKKIRPGTTASYSDVAKSIAQPSSARAVALACGANPVAVAIPCHRVVKSDGALSGYRWGIERKRALLDREATSKPSRTKK
ncbi:MAG: bifunctional DNA-binding transcriptional regulator/O6-methylguanine-DNA methyltransferase Ada [Hyphomicrobium sp.]|nr:MAG: bifunctional DNA-binding transcriptional regulator/O6-methylguanine-DNA methyltransferase Ada [Hyphomicrobium sp.]PPD00471.1 MAG: bifunctional DNA-binding transcriptional regulator/O6-methylguanine-DNA methyltransferase Ada [Hyphomicrobium sp.]